MNPNQINQIVQMIGMVNNPESFLQNAIKSNPQIQPMLNQIQQSGMNPTEFLKNYAQNNHIDLSPIMDILNKKGVKF